MAQAWSIGNLLNHCRRANPALPGEQEHLQVHGMIVGGYFLLSIPSGGYTAQTEKYGMGLHGP